MRRCEFSVCLAVRLRGRSLRAIRQMEEVSRMGDGCATPKGQFQLGHSGGRPKGARNRLAAQVFEDILRHWCEPAAPGSKLCKGAEALETLYKEKPGEYLRLTASVLPREFVRRTFTSDLDDEQIDELLLALRQRMINSRTGPALLASADGARAAVGDAGKSGDKRGPNGKGFCGALCQRVGRCMEFP